MDQMRPDRASKMGVMVNRFFERVAAVDAVVGDGIERLVCAKHRWRLTRLGSDALDPGDGWWAEGDPSPRKDCQLEVLVDGAEALAAMAEAIGRARESVYITGWHVAPYFEL